MTKQEFKTLFDLHFDAIRGYIFYRGADTELATDIAQESFMQLWEKQFEYHPKQNVGLLYKIAGNIFVSKYRRQQTETNYRNSLKIDTETDSPEEQAEYEELVTQYEKALAQLPEKQRVVFLMSRVDELKYHEIAERLNISPKAVEKRMSTALDYLKKAIIIGTLLLLLLSLQ